MRQTLNLNVNGKAVSVEADPNGKLLYLLRNDVDCRGTRFGCGGGHCGACTVIINGHAEQSCTVPAWSADQATVTTAEGLAADPVGRIVLDAFLAEQAGQCGYCVAGIMMSVTALLQRTTTPTQVEIDACLTRHLCRCGAHVRILRAVRRAIAACQSGATAS